MCDFRMRVLGERYDVCLLLFFPVGHVCYAAVNCDPQPYPHTGKVETVRSSPCETRHACCSSSLPVA